MLFGCCTDIAHYDLLAECGCDSITLACKDIAAMSDTVFEDCLSVIRNGRLKLLSLNSFSPPDIRLTGDEFSILKLAQYAESLLLRASQLGVQYVGIGAPLSRNLPLGYDYRFGMEQFSEALKLLCSIGEPLGIDILLEAVCDIECNFITTTTQALELVSKLSLPNLHIVYDIYHAHMMNEGVAPILDAAGEIKVVHIAQDMESGQRHYLNPEKIDEYRPYIAALRQIDYSGEIAVEAFYGDIGIGLRDSLAILNLLLRRSQ